MRMSASAHFSRTRRVCDYNLLALYAAVVLVLVWLNWDWLAARSWITALTLAVLFIGCSQFGIVMIFSRTILETVRELTCAQCAKCGGPSWYEEQQDSSKRRVVYICGKCGLRESLTATYLDEIPHGEPHGGADGLGGGGG